MLYEIMKSIRNFFVKESRFGRYEIKEGKISLPFLIEGDRFIIEGSKRNDERIFVYPAENMKDEEFEGRIVMIDPPESFLSLVAEIEEYCSTNKATPYQSESFGGYSYTKATSASGNLASWQTAFGTRLNAWRKI